MKDELKTLKDLDIMKGKVHALGGEVGVDELRAEAVKWVKDLYRIEKKRGNWIKGSKNNNHISPRNSGKIVFIKHFFNLKESDLK